MTWQRVAAVLTALALFAAGCADDDADVIPTEPLTYDRAGIGFAYPGDWEILEHLMPEDGIDATDGASAAVGRIDAAGNLVGVAVRTSPAVPPVPPGEEHNFLEATLDRHADEIWGEGTVRETEWTTLDGRDARRYLVDYTARGEQLTNQVTVSAEGPRVVVVQCQAPTDAFDLIVPWCAMVTGTLQIDLTAHADSAEDASS